MKLGFSLHEKYGLPMTQVIDLVAQAGFCAVSLSWDREADLQSTVDHARSLGLPVQSLHGPLRGMPAMWTQAPGGIREDILQAATDCARLGIPILVIHPWNGVDYTFREEGLCFAHFDALVCLAENLGITVAFENLEGHEYLAALMQRYEGRKTVGFCWDSGHERCYTPGMDLLQPYADRLVMTHLNDNLGVTDPGGKLQGTDDLHLFPYDGNQNWEDTVSRLKAAREQEILNFEIKIRPKGDRCKLDLYSAMPLEDYFRQAYQRAAQAVGGYFAAPALQKHTYSIEANAAERGA